MRIALLNCYLQKDWAFTAEIESTGRLVSCARRMGIEVRAFARSEDLEAFAPDFVLSIAYNDAKLTGHPTYALLTMPLAWIADVPRFPRNVLTYDGYWTVTPGTERYVGELFKSANKPNLRAFAALSIGRTNAAPLELQPASYAAYLGTNWDGHRHGELFKLLAQRGSTKFFGKEERWLHIPREAYGGEVEFDGTAAQNTYRSAGIGLCLNHPDFDREGIPTNRIFEIPAAGAVMISTRNRLVEEVYGDSVLYFDTEKPIAQVAEQIDAHVQWVRAQPIKAREMARAANEAFNSKLSQEKFLENAIELHETACRQLGYPRLRSSTHSARPKFQRTGFKVVVAVYASEKSEAQLLASLRSIAVQSLKPHSILIVDATERGIAGSSTASAAGDIPVVNFSGEQDSVREALREVALRNDAEWMCCINAGDVLYPNHFWVTAAAAERHYNEQRGRYPEFVHSGAVQVSRNSDLSELMIDAHNVPRAERIRLAQFSFAPATIEDLDRLGPASVVVRVPVEAVNEATRSPHREAKGVAFTGAVTVAIDSNGSMASYGEFDLPQRK